MPTGSSLFARAEQHIGERYEHAVVPKDEAGYRGPWDCAEFASWLVYQEAEKLYGCRNNAASPATADAYTGYWKRDARTVGHMIPVAQAAGIKGAFLLRYPPEGPDEMGHIAVSDGQGGTVEAMDRARGVARGKVTGRRWDTGVLIDGIDYDAAHDVPVAPPPLIYAQNQANMERGVIERIQDALQAKSVAVTSPRGVFDAALAQAVAAFQKSAGLVVDGEVGPQTASALGINLAGVAMAAASAAFKIGTTLVNPLVSIAAWVLPEILKALVGEKAAAVAERVVKAVTETAGTSEPDKAKAVIEADPVAKQQLQVRLAELVVQQEEQREQARLEAARVQAESERLQRESQLKELEAQLADVRDARDQATIWASQGSLMQWGPLLVSGLVLFGFLFLLGYFVALMFTPQLPSPNNQIYQLVNISFGALTTAFATVVSFWLGSSQGSRAKDVAAIAREAEHVSQGSVPPAPGGRTAPNGSASDPKPPQSGMAPSNFDNCLDLVFGREGGFSNDSRDNGGPTQFGITLATLKSWRKAQGDDSEVTIEILKALTKDEANAIYRNRYWNPLRGDDLPKGVDLIVFDFGVNAGPATAAKMLQKIVGADPDGAIGPATLRCVALMKPRDIIDEMARRRIDYYKNLEDWDAFGKGWTNRTEIIAGAARDMIRTSETRAAA
ncbi:glycosyl hydrolase 108 family protein [Bosea sp. BH3]|uniref:glycosyl hydrolase 108 family protein n=1 Tax=Bosea sp. BH3 TaxID=2871701 RepID=UPI0021CB8CFB|nr:glycosyl hydrolase 108 family protein [Bosea sp. BH3]MCU4182388.1 peptidoglycan-binding protein [Bosea sp. BH3]